MVARSSTSTYVRSGSSKSYAFDDFDPRLLCPRTQTLVFRFHIVALLSLLLGACIPLPIPHDHRLTPLYSGIVIDLETGHPISGVTVPVETVNRLAEQDGPRFATAETSQDGHYEVSVAERRWAFVVILGPAEGVCAGRAQFTHPDYEPFSFETDMFGGAAFGGACAGVVERRDVRLKRRQAKDSTQSG
jgi:hypothetical protein